MSKRSQRRAVGGIPAKLTPPVLPAVLERDRVQDLLDEARRRTLVWICGPSGGGKTTLVASYLERRALPAIWLTLDPEDRDPGSFFHFLTASARRVIGEELNLPRPTQQVEWDPLPFARAWFRQLAEELPAPAAIVIDDCQILDPESPVLRSMGEAAGQLPAGVTLICLSREPPPAVMAPLRARRRLAVVDWQKIRFDEEETARLVEMHSMGRGQVVPPVLVDAITRQARGWPAGVILLTEALQDQGTGRIPRMEPGDTVFEYFSRGIFADIDPGIQTFLLEITPLPRMTPSIAAKQSGREDAGDLLAALHRRSTFIERRFAHEWVYQLHPLFREFLERLLEERCSPEERSDLQRRAGAILASAGWIEEAIGAFSASGTHAQLRDVVLEHAPHLVATGRTGVLAEWISRLPPAMIGESAELSYWSGICRLGRAPGEAQTMFERALSIARRSGDEAAALRAWCGAIDAAILTWKNFDDLVRLIDDVPELPSSIEPGLERRAAAAMVGALVHGRPRAREMKRWIETLRSRMEVAGDAGARLMDASRLLQYAMWTGDGALGESVVLRYGALADDPEVSPLARLVWWMLTVGERWLRAEFDQSLAEMDATLALANELGVSLLDHQITGMGVYATLCREDGAAAAPLLARLDPADARLRLLDLSHHQYLHAWGALVRGEPAEALRLGTDALELTEGVGAPFPEALNRLLLAQVHAEAGEMGRVREMLGRALEISREMESAILLLPGHLLASQAARSAGDAVAAERHLEEGFAAGRAHDVVNFPGWRARWMAARCHEALRSGIETDYVRSLIRRRQLPAPPDAGDEWPWLLRVRTFGGLRIESGGREIRFSGKAPKRALDLLEVLLALGGENVAETMLADLLWPDAEGDAALQSLATTLHRLRRLVGYGEVIHRSGGALSLDRERCWWDAAVVGSIVDEHPIEDEKVESEKINLLLELYRGPFLQETDEPWVLPRRRQLRDRVVARLSARGTFLEKEGRDDDAVDLYLRGLAADPLAETMLQGLLRCYSRQGRRGAITAAYRDFEAHLDAALGMKPSTKTRALVDMKRSVPDL